jgi:sedoheptulokinase
VGAGNGLRKNPALRRALEGLFGMPLVVPPYGEEAACGAAKIAAK